MTHSADTTTAVTVRSLERREIRAAARLLAGAFAADPFIGHFLQDPARRRLAYPPFFRAVLHDLADRRALYASQDGRTLVGVAAWAPPGQGPARAPARLRALADRGLVHTVFPRATSQLLSAFSTLREHHPREPHWYLAFVAIEPTQQRKGIGSALLEPALAKADHDHIPCYLETPFPDTRAFYRRLGFEPTAELRPVAGAPPVWSMTRPA